MQTQICSNLILPLFTDAQVQSLKSQYSKRVSPENKIKIDVDVQIDSNLLLFSRVDN